MNTEWSRLINCFHLSEAGIDEPVFLDRSVGRSGVLKAHTADEMDLLWWHGRACHRRCRRSHRRLVVHLSEIQLLCFSTWMIQFVARSVSAFAKPHRVGEAYVSFAMTVVMNTWIECRHCSFLVNRGFSWHTETVRMMLFIWDGIYHWKVLGECNFKYIQGGIFEKTVTVTNVRLWPDQRKEDSHCEQINW